MLTWQSEERFVVGDTTFQTLSPDFFDPGRPGVSMDGADFLVAKPRRSVEAYVELIRELRPRRIFELGI